jgi:hypothetical protein
MKHFTTAVFLVITLVGCTGANGPRDSSPHIGVDLDSALAGRRSALTPAA